MASAVVVDVDLTESGLEIHAAEGSTVRLWSYGRLRSSVPLSTKHRDVLLSLEPDGAETLFVADPAFAGKLLGRAPALSAGRHRLRALRPGLAVLGAALTVAAGVWLLDFQPAQTLARLMPQPTREALGRQVVASLARDRKECRTPASQVALARLTKRLAAAAPDKALAVRVAVLDWPLVNAFAVPGGQVILTRGLIETSRSPDEVAGVLAHELGHAIELHPEAGLVRVMGLLAATQLIFAGSSGNLTNLGVILTQLRYTRIAEGEADAHAIRLLKAAGISPKGLGDFLARIDAKPERARPDAEAETSGSFLDLISTHPPTAERINLVRAQPAYPVTPALSDEDWRALRGACIGIEAPAAPSPAKAADPDREIAEASKTLAGSPGDVAALERRGRAYARKRMHAQALADFSKAVQIKPSDATLRFHRGQALQSLDRKEDALLEYGEVIRLAPAHTGARNSRGNIYRTLKRYEAAVEDFNYLLRFNPNFAPAHYNRALVYVDLAQIDAAERDLTLAIGLDKDYAAAYAQRGLLRERRGVREEAIADFRAALAAPAKLDSGPGAHRIARARLAALGVQ
jgi:predicted Zn-dependent protease